MTDDIIEAAVDGVADPQSPTQQKGSGGFVATLFNNIGFVTHLTLGAAIALGGLSFAAGKLGVTGSDGALSNLDSMIDGDLG